ncbi:U3 small nucleolar ribonucleoprotein protein MPP10 [Hyla sarda]|uniref:U3 small nucleolar ribonucleoprotein protein MPP10 n=1 Tax=Hyla sarda TaxID=327740 RepID=UPI0024C3DE32|nr:U3 small nucleolar ribonucleoprotein protein MPP10 [Hyla sarda]
MAEVQRPRLWQCMGVLEAVDAHPEQLLSVQEGLASEFSNLTKALYDLHKSEGALQVGSPLNELIIENFDEEQIWQQLELQNRAVLGHFSKAVSQTVKDKDIYVFQQSQEEEEPSENEQDEEEGSEIDQEEEALEDSSKNVKGLESKGRNGRILLTKNSKRVTVEQQSDDDSDMDFDIDKLEKERKKNTSRKAVKKSIEKSIVDDKFFKLSEMEAFLEAAEKEDDNRKNEEDDDEEKVDYFEDIESFDDDDESDEEITKDTKAAKSSRDFLYKDFFDPVEDDENGTERQWRGQEGDGLEDNEEEMGEDADEEDADNDDVIEEDDEDFAMEETEESKKAKDSFKRVTFDLSDGSEGEEVADILGGKKKSDQPNESKSSFEKREEKMAEKIQVLQKQMLEEKSWQLGGEVTAQKRPENSLLSESLLFDHASRMAPVITEETTVQLEDIIKQRIKDQVWDDVVRKEKPKEDAFEYKKRLALDHDKSKLSLAEIYEQEYLKLNQKKTEEEEDPKHIEIQKLMDNLFLKLDALSNFHFTPKPAVPEMKVVSNLPAISMEEVAPLGVSEAALLAPEEIKEKNKSGDIKTNAEKTDTDKKRERRKKKTIKRVKIKEREKRQKLAEKMRAEKGKKQTKKEAEANLKKLTKEGKATMLKDEGKDKALKSSQAFFSQLQDQVKLQIKGAKTVQKKPKKSNELSAHKLKL